MSVIPIAAKVIDILKLGNVSSLAVAGEGAVAYSQSFPLPAGNPNFSFEYKAESSGSVALKLELEQSNQAPTTEGAEDGNFVVPDGAEELDNSLADEVNHIKAYLPAATAFARVKITGLTGNDAETVLSKLKMVYIQ